MWKGWLISVIPATVPLSMHIRSEKQLLWKTAVLKDAEDHLSIPIARP